VRLWPCECLLFPFSSSYLLKGQYSYVQGVKSPCCLATSFKWNLFLDCWTDHCILWMELMNSWAYLVDKMKRQNCIMKMQCWCVVTLALEEVQCSKTFIPHDYISKIRSPHRNITATQSYEGYDKACAFHPSPGNWAMCLCALRCCHWETNTHYLWSVGLRLHTSLIPVFFADIMLV